MKSLPFPVLKIFHLLITLLSVSSLMNIPVIAQQLPIAKRHGPAGQVVIQGKVTAANGLPLPYITITVEGTTLGTAASTDGTFTLHVDAGTLHTIIASAIGFAPQSKIVLPGVDENVTLHFILTESSIQMQEVIVEAQRYTHTPSLTLDNISVKAPAPLTIISRKMIEQMGSRRLDEVLREQTGLAIVQDVGSGARAVGLQMQGFDAAYTMIMIDGQPLIGRNAGSMDLSRITVANVERIEIIKGASSSLLGSDALGGVVNIVTRKDITTPQALAMVRYGSYYTTDATLEGERPFAGNKGTAYLSANYYRTAGFNVNPYLTSGNTAPPYNSYTLQGRAHYALSKKNALSISGRYATRTSENEYAYQANRYTDALAERDLNTMTAFHHTTNRGTRIKAHHYFTHYNTDQEVRLENNGSTLQGNRFAQSLHRFEALASHPIKTGLTITGGLGGNLEILNNNRYEGRKDRRNQFAYAQGDWQPSTSINIIAGLRYDYYTGYGGKLNPSAGIHYTISDAVTLKASAGRGFKVPDFKAMYQVFTNMQVGYTVIGAEVFTQTWQAMQEAGQVNTVMPSASRITSLKAETSSAYNAGATGVITKTLQVEVNAFYNDVQNLITTVPVGTRPNGQQIFSYVNIASVYLTGAEASLQWKPVSALSVTAGYQLLYAKDRGVIDSIRHGTGLYGTVRNANTGAVRTARTSDYFGLDNRSRHMANIKLYYEYTPWNMGISLRINYRGKYGYADANNNYYIDRYDTFVAEYFLLNASLEKKLFAQHLTLQLTADNVLNYTDMLMPGSPGRTITASIGWRFFSPNQSSHTPQSHSNTP